MPVRPSSGQRQRYRIIPLGLSAAALAAETCRQPQHCTNPIRAFNSSARLCCQPVFSSDVFCQHSMWRTLVDHPSPFHAVLSHTTVLAAEWPHGCKSHATMGLSILLALLLWLVAAGFVIMMCCTFSATGVALVGQLAAGQALRYAPAHLRYTSMGSPYKQHQLSSSDCMLAASAAQHSRIYKCCQAQDTTHIHCVCMAMFCVCSLADTLPPPSESPTVQRVQSTLKTTRTAFQAATQRAPPFVKRSPWFSGLTESMTPLLARDVSSNSTAAEGAESSCPANCLNMRAVTCELTGQYCAVNNTWCEHTASWHRGGHW